MIQNILSILLVLLFFGGTIGGIVIPFIYSQYRKRKKIRELDQKQILDLEKRDSERNKNSLTVFLPMATFISFSKTFGYITALIISLAVLLLVQFCYFISDKLSDKRGR